MHYDKTELTPEPSTLSTERRPVNVRPLLASVLELMMSVIDGPSSCEWFARLDQDGSWLKTFQGSCQLMLDGSLEIFSGSWPRRGILFAGNVGELPTWERRTEESVCSFSGTWPTPTINGNYNRKGLSKNSGDGLATAVNMWPTPKSSTCGMTAKTSGCPMEKSTHLETQVYLAENWATPSAADAQGSHGGGQGRSLRTDIWELKQWPTPRASDYKGSGPIGSKSAEHMLDRGYLCAEVMYATPQARDYRTGQKSRAEDPNRQNNLNDQIGGQLNPDWVEALQGLEPGWTKLPEGWKKKNGKAVKNNEYEALPAMREAVREKAISSRCMGACSKLRKKEILLSAMRWCWESESRCNISGGEKKINKIPWRKMRAVRKRRYAECTPYGYGSMEQRSEEFNDIMRIMPHFIALEDGESNSQEKRRLNWMDEAARRLEAQRWPAGKGQAQYDWEPPRVAKGMPNRATRIEIIGNACPPQQYYVGMAVIAAIEQALNGA